ncbi:histidinol-phosphate transaminase [Celerinatantimonas diazotrophica]|uniref:Histidinol-phosphate aminotransferase n=1 Tax=Celerinatantimonas diazotrophica TaxID=412034 RepID=A0A4R1K1D5_9GAMM|nr:histidinol-phosphate transaminase [Celerinatantimonas diazotrophica]TCK57806.1 histidinol-phosphate aminotransferase [Celerinatantimonas diazotrophica]CAG9298130.1 Histidinol-phosphate aminotransferase [Celerinatantimonas diazotrophica]
MPNTNASIHSLVSQYVQPLASYNAGLSLEELKKRYNVTKVAKLASNENPFGTSAAVAKVLNDAGNLAYYPDPNCSELRQLLGQKFNVDPQTLVFGNGSEDIISVLCRVFLEAGDNVLTIVPSFGLHILYPQSCGANVLIAEMSDTLEFDIEKIVQQLQTHQPKLFFIASPSNPVGTALSQAEIETILDALTDQTLLIFDEAYYEYAQTDANYPNVQQILEQSGKPYVLLRTLSKAYSLAGLRIGYGICSEPSIAGYIDKVRTPFNVNRIAQKAAIAALNDATHIEKTLTWNDQARQTLSEQLNELGIQPAKSLGNFLFFKTDYPAIELAQKLLKHGVIVKPWLEAGYEHYLRVSIGSQDENEHFLSALKTILNA